MNFDTDLLKGAVQKKTAIYGHRMTFEENKIIQNILRVECISKETKDMFCRNSYITLTFPIITNVAIDWLVITI